MKKFLAVLLLGLFSFSANADTSKKVCEQIMPAMVDLKKKTPMDVDYMTQLTDVGVVYENERCFLNYSYLLKSDLILKEVMDVNDMTKEESISFINTEAGLTQFQIMFDELASEAAERNFKLFKKVKGMHISYVYAFDNDGIPAFEATVLDNKF